MRAGCAKEFLVWQRPRGLLTQPMAAPQSCQFGSQQSQQSFTANGVAMKESNVNDYSDGRQFNPLFIFCQDLFSGAALK
jgi:hypothetical protein